MATPKIELKDWVRSPAWFRAFWVATGLSVVAYVTNVVISQIDPGNAWGITYGIVATVLMLGALLYGVRRRMLKYNLGRSRTWVQYHVYGGTLFMVLVFMHSGFRLPAGPLNWLLWILSIWVTVSGLLGVLLQRWIPRLLSSGLSVEVVYERIPELVEDLRAQSEGIVSTCSEPVRDFYQYSLADEMQSPRERPIYFLDITGGIQSRLRKFEYVQRVLSADESHKFDELQSRYKTKLELDAHYTLQKALRWWLYLHVPPSILLTVLVAIHIYVILAY